MHFRESRKEIENKMETKSRKMKFTDLKDMLNQTGEVYGDRPAYIFKTEEKGKFRTITHKEFRENINALGTTLIQMGLKDKRIALISENRYEWELSYLAVAAGVGVIVPLDKALPDNELESLILRSQVEAIIYSSKYDAIMNTLREKKNTNLKYFISMDLEENTQGIYAEKALVEKGKKLLADGNKTYIDAKIDAEKMGIMLFTSGTTAMSKAVMLSHKNLVTNVMDIIQRFDLTDEDRFLSFLPLHHVFECTVGFLYPISIGGSIAFCEGVKHMAENIKEFEITAMISVPAVFDIIYRKVMKTIEKKGKLANLEKGKKVSQFLLKMKIDLRKQLFKEVHESLGPKLKLVVTGGAALDPETEKGFNDLGFDVEQGYGLTETAPVISAENFKKKKSGSIGFPIEVVVASTWNKELAQAWGECMGKISQEMGAEGWYAPGMNTHRTAFGARNYEYFSEDGVLAGNMGAKAVEGARKYGVYSYIKHFALYEGNAKMVSVWSNEQAIREIYLKPFEISVKQGGANAVMVSWSFLGDKWTGESSNLMNTVLRDEWGFRGMALTDFFRNNGHGFMNADAALANGVDAMLSTFNGEENNVANPEHPTSVLQMRNACKNVMYTVVSSWAYDGEHEETGMENWKKAGIGIDIVIALFMAGMEVLIIRGYKKRKNAE